MRKKIIILGGGLTGLSAADKLLSNDYEVTIIEKESFLGGLASSFKIEGEEIPKFNHHIIKSNTTTLRYLERFNLMRNNLWKKINMTFGINGKLHNINIPQGLLRFNYLSIYGRIRFGLFGAYLIFLLNPDKIDPELDAETWLKKLAGKEVTEKIWYNLYGRNKFNIPLNQINAKQFANRLCEKEGYDEFTFPTKGLQGMIDGLAKSIIQKGGEIHTKIIIEELDLTKNTITFSKNNKKHQTKFSIIINTIPVQELIKFTKGLPSGYIEKLKKVRYTPVVGLAFGTEEFLDKKNYWINLFQERIHVIYQHSILIDKYKSKVTWCVRYGGSIEDLNKTDKEIKELYLDVIKKYFPNMKLNWCFVFRDKYAEPIYDKYYINYAPTYKTPLNNLYMAGIQITFPKIRNMNVALESGEKVAELIIKED